MFSTTTTVYLTDDVLVLLDGKTSNAHIQSEVDKAKSRILIASTIPGRDELTEKELAFLVRIVESVKTTGALSHAGCEMRQCEICGKQKSYGTYPRSSRHHKKGDTNYNVETKVYGVDFAQGIVIMTGIPTLGCCSDCASKLIPYIKTALVGIPVQISTTSPLYNELPKYIKTPHKHCKICDWTGNEQEMGDLYALMNGTYKGLCLKCGAKNTLFLTNIETVDGHDLIAVNPTHKA